MNINQLNHEFAIDGQLKFVANTDGFPLIQINNFHSAALISLYGGQILSFKPHNAAYDLLFLSENAIYKEGKAIRGGIPICWPWFGAHPFSPDIGNHGFARNHWWEVVSTSTLANDATQIHLRLVGMTSDKKIWPAKSRLELKATFDNMLSLELTTFNPGLRRFAITQALHAYFNVGNIREITILGLENTEYFDKLEHNAQKLQTEPVKITEETDRIYTDAQKTVIIDDPVFKRQILINSSNTKTAIVWNPWLEQSAKMNDLAADDYQHFVCVEAGNVAESINIHPGGSFSLATHFTLKEY